MRISAGRPREVPILKHLAPLCVLSGMLCGLALTTACSKNAESPANGKTAPETASAGGKGTSRPFYADAFPGIKFERPVFLAEVPGKPETFLVLEQPGAIQIVSRRDSAGAWGKTPFARIDVTGGGSGGDERGLLGFAFHPDFAANRRYFVYFVKGSEDVLEEGLADPSLLKDSGRPRRGLLRIPDPYQNHNGGTLAFGPKDGYLYLGTGDGGSAGDPHGNGQNRKSLLGKFLRIDVNMNGMNNAAEGKAYGIPKDNPFLDGDAAPEVWAYGFRNPWKWSFDAATGDLWAGDVGQNTLEEVDLIEKGGNYGWNAWEGDRCHSGKGPDCDLSEAGGHDGGHNGGHDGGHNGGHNGGHYGSGHRLPLFTYGRDEKGGISVTGGFVYRGDAKSPYNGSFIFGDYGTNNVWALKKDGKATPLPRAPDIGISSFGVDSQGRMYVMGVFGETLYRMDGLQP
jgi:glucose/arabinose dehydrogenase